MEKEPVQGLDGDVEIELVPGGPGQFDVKIGDETIATRSSGWQRFFGGGWPLPREVADAVREHG